MANILFVDQFAVMGGAQRILVDLASALAAAGHSATALFPEIGPVRDTVEARGIKTGMYLLRNMRAGRKAAVEKLRYFASATKSARSIRAAAGSTRFDLIYVNGPRSVLPAVLAARSMRTPVAVAVHLIHEGAERKLLQWCFARPQVRLVSFCSRFAAEPFANLEGKGKIVPNWVAPPFLEEPSRRGESRAHLGVGNDAVCMGVLGRVSKTKGQRLLLEAAAPLLQGDEHLQILLAGGADFEDSQEELDLKAEYARYGERVRFLDKASAIPFLDALDISVVPSIRPESFGLVAIESMARSLPVVATRRGGLQDTVVDGQTGFLVEPFAAEMRSALTKLVADRELRFEMGRSGRARSESEYSPAILIPKAVAAVLEAAA